VFLDSCISAGSALHVIAFRHTRSPPKNRLIYALAYLLFLEKKILPE